MSYEVEVLPCEVETCENVDSHYVVYSGPVGISEHPSKEEAEAAAEEERAYLASA